MALERVEIHVRRIPGTEDIPLPQYATLGSAGLDLCAAVESSTIIQPGERELIPTGIHIAVPDGYEAQIRPRSGLALKEGISVLNAPGTIDSDYRGPVQVILINLGNKPFEVKRGDRIAQMVIAPVARAVFIETSSLPETARNDGGFGHTGV